MIKPARSCPDSGPLRPLGICVRFELHQRRSRPVFPFEMVRMPAGGWFAGRDPVTQGEYAEVTGERPSHFPGDDDRPVESVSWEDANGFCEQLTARERAAGRLPPGWRYDLPTDAQWDEMLADADPKTAVTSQAVPREGTVPVAEAGPPNRLGIRGMLGNVWQWCRDWYDEGIRRKDSQPGRARGRAGDELAGNAAPLVRWTIRRTSATRCCAAARGTPGRRPNFSPRARLRYAPGMANARTGFRCVLEFAGGGG